MTGMAPKKSAKAVQPNVDDILDKSLELELDDSVFGPVGMEPSMDELEAQIMEAADELTKSEAAKNEAAKKEQSKASAEKAQKKTELAPKPLAQATETPAKPVKSEPTDLPPAPIQKPVQKSIAAIAAANDPGRKDRRARAADITKQAPKTIYWLAALASAVWVGGVAAFANLFYGPDIWQAPSLSAFFARPYAAGLVAAALIPLLLIWGFANLVRRAQEMRMVAQSMAEAALRLSEPESMATDRIMMVGQAVRREVQAMSEGIERTLARASELETLVHTEVNELERAYSDNEIRIRSLVDGLGTERESIISHAERVRASISGAHEQLREELSQAAEIIRDNVLNASTQLTMTITDSGQSLVKQINDSGGKIHYSIDERTSSFSEMLSTRGQALASLLDERVATITDRTDSATSKLSQMLETRTGGMVSLLTEATNRMTGEFDSRLDGIDKLLEERGRNLIDQFETRAHALDAGTEKLNTALEVRARQINETLLERTREISKTFGEGRDLFTQLVENGKTDVKSEFTSLIKIASDNLDKFGSLVRERKEELESSVSLLTNSASKNLSDFNGTIEARTREISERIGLMSHTTAEALDGLAASIDARRDDIARSVNSLTDVATDSITGFELAIDAKKDEFTEHMSSLVDVTTQKIDEQSSLLADRMAQSNIIITKAVDRDLARMTEARERISAEISTDIARVGEAFSAQTGIIEERTAGMERALFSGVDKVRKTLEESAAAVAGTLRDKIRDGAAALGEETNKASDLLGGHSIRLTDRLGEILADAEDRITAKAENVVSVFDEIDQRMVGRTHQSSAELHARAKAIEEAIGEATSRLNTASAEAGRKLGTEVEQIAAFFERLDQNIIGRVQNTSEDVEARARQIEAAIDQAASVLHSAASGATARFGEEVDRISKAFDEIDQRFAGRSAGTMRDLESKTAEIEAAIGTVAQRVEEVSGGIGSRFDNEIGKVVQVFEDADQRIMARTHQTSAELDARTRQIEAALVQATEGLRVAASAAGSQLGEHSKTTITTLEARTRELNEVLAARTEEIANLIEEKARPLIEGFAEGGGKLTASLEAATEQATEKLRRQNAALVNALATRTAETLTAVEEAQTSLGENVSSLIDRLSASNSKLGELIDMATTNLSSVDQRLTGTTAAFAQSATKAAESIATSTRLIDSNAGRLSELSGKTLTEIGTIAARFEDHGRVLQQASDLIGSAQSNLSITLEERQEALEKLAIGLVRKSEEIEKSMRAFEDVISKSLDKTEGRAKSTTEEIRRAMQDIIEASSDRFTNATDDIRRTAASIRTELHETREELRRGVLDLPEETRESTTAMRRAVSEQMNALKELADIVARSSRTLEVTEARVAPARAAGQPVPRSPEPARREPERAAPPPLRGSFGDAPAAAPVRLTPASAPAPVPVPAPATAARSGQTQSGGWVTDLLRRASREEEPSEPQRAPAPAAKGDRSPLHVMESLNSLSVDIARAIDHDASVELWERYRRGERNVFTRRLYTLKGQQTFDEIRRKYNAEQEFRTAVDRYLDDFEKLLEDVSRNDRDNIMTQTYLTSDTGKVYTMLAHASGRLR